MNNLNKSILKFTDESMNNVSGEFKIIIEMERDEDRVNFDRKCEEEDAFCFDENVEIEHVGTGIYVDEFYYKIDDTYELALNCNGTHFGVLDDIFYRVYLKKINPKTNKNPHKKYCALEDNEKVIVFNNLKKATKALTVYLEKKLKEINEPSK